MPESPVAAAAGSPEAPVEEANRWSGYLPLPLILLAAAIRHAGALRAPFFADDFLFLEQVRGRSILGALFSPDPIGNFLRPVSRQLYFWLVGAVSGESPLVFHALNLTWFLAILALLYAITRRVAGTLAATVATGFVALHYAADVPVLWVSGCQDLLAILFALSSLYLVLHGRSWMAACALALALLSKETVVFTAPIAFAMLTGFERRDWREAARRCAPVFGVTALWAVVYLLSLASRPALKSGVSLDVGSLLAGLLHLPQVVLGLEFRSNKLLGFHPTSAVLIPLICVLAAVVAQWFAMQRGRARLEPAGSTEWRAVAAWALLGTLPALAVAPIWSAYFYLFALCGVGVAAGIAGRHLPLAALLVGITLVAVSNDSASHLDEFADQPGAGAGRSHVNAHSIRRSMTTVDHFLGQMKAARPTLPHGSVVLFGNVPGSIGWQAGDGPLVRWAYADTSLRSYYLTSFPAERARGRSLYFFAVEGGNLVDKSDDPLLLQSLAFSMFLDDKHASARDVLGLLLERDPESRSTLYWLGLAQWGAGDTLAARRSFGRLGASEQALPAAEQQELDHVIARGDSARALQALLEARDRYPTEPWIHRRLSALTLNRPALADIGFVEAYAFHVLSPNDPDAWRKWATAQLAQEHFEQASVSMDRYFELGGEAAKNDQEALQVRESLRRIMPGGDLARTTATAP